MLRTPNLPDMQDIPAGTGDRKRILEFVRRMETVSAQTMRADGTSPCVLPFSVHDRDGRLVYASQSLRQLFGPVRSGSAFLDLVHVQDRVAAAHALSNAAIGHEVKPVALRMLTPQGDRAASGTSFGWFELACTRHAGSRGPDGFVVASIRNVTRERDAEAELSRSKEASEAASVAKSRFLANISHELRTPLNAILGFSELLGSPLAAGMVAEKKAEYVSLIHTSASHLLSVLNDILDMSKIETGQYTIVTEHFALSKCLAGTLSIMEGQARVRNIKLTSSGLDDLPAIVADERAIRQIMINLLSNAIKFSENGQSVHVDAFRRARSVVIRVTDRGIGISREHIKDIGKPFFQADSQYDRRYEGTGLGLSVVKGLVGLHGGTVRIESERGQGTTVTLTLPILGPMPRQVAGDEEFGNVAVLRRQVTEENEAPTLMSGTG